MAVYKKVTPVSVTCAKCGANFLSNQRKAKFCSDKCRKMTARERSGVSLMDKYPKMKRLSVWKMSELIVCADLMQKGFDVFIAASPSSYCDLIAKKEDGVLYEVEVRTGYITQGGSTAFARSLRDTANIYGVYFRDGRIIYYDKSLNVVSL